MVYLGLGCNIAIHNRIIDGYDKAGKLDEMENALSNMLNSEENVPNIYTMNSTLWAYGNHGRVDAMVKWCSELQLMGVEPDTRHSVSYGKANMLERMMLVL
jgi:pentatricopeptide repeat protein